MSDTPKVGIHLAASLKERVSLDSRWEIRFHWKAESDFNKKFVLDQS